MPGRKHRKQIPAQPCFEGRWCWPQRYFNNKRSRLDVMNKRKKPNKTNKQPAESPICFQSQAGVVPKELALLKSYPVFLYPTSQLFKKKYNPIDGQYQMLSSRTKAMTADMWDPLKHICLSPLLPSTAESESPSLGLHSDSGPFIMNPSITNQTAMWRLRQLFLNALSYNSRMSICRSAINQCLPWNLCLCKNKGEEFRQPWNHTKMHLKVRNTSVMPVNVTANGNRESQVSWGVALQIPGFLCWWQGVTWGRAEGLPGLWNSRSHLRS